MHAKLFLSLVITTLIASTTAKIRCDAQEECIDYYQRGSSSCPSDYTSIIFQHPGQTPEVQCERPCTDAEQKQCTAQLCSGYKPECETRKIPILSSCRRTLELCEGPVKMPEHLCTEESMDRPVQYNPETGTCHALKPSRRATVVAQIFYSREREQTPETITMTCTGLSDSGLEQYMSEVRKNKDVSWEGKSGKGNKKLENHGAAVKDYAKGCYIGNGDIQSLVPIIEKECRAAQSQTGFETAFETDRETDDSGGMLGNSCCPIFMKSIGQSENIGLACYGKPSNA